MRRAAPRFSAGLWVLALTLSCTGPAIDDDAVSAHAASTTAVWVELHSGPRSGQLEPDAHRAAMEGHFANMGRLVEAGHPWVAGPLGEPKLDPDHRGLFLIDAPTVARALELAGSDPAVEAGVFAMVARRFTTRDPLGVLPELDRRHQAAREAARPGEAVPWEGRLYVLALPPGGEDCEATVQRLVADRAALFTLRFDDGEQLGCLDAETVTAARTRLVAAGAGKLVGSWRRTPGYASTGLTDLPAEPR